LIIIAVLVLNVFGINTTSIAAMLGAMTLAIGLALRETLANVAAGIMILVVRPFLTGHYIEIGENKGNVRSINLFNTELATLDNIQIFIPNNEVWKSSIRNYSAFDRRRLELVVGIDYGANLDKAMRLAKRTIEADPRAILMPEPFVGVTELASSSVDLTIRVWCLSGDFASMKVDLLKALKETFDQAGIAIPYPHLEVIHKEVPPLAADVAGGLAPAGSRPS
jgi:small conductance mechanosensitive channel